ncbi:CAP domain-containing protein [Streptomyces sp. NPDC058295]|uniref:CAP domain-containing protein n=1 Tax=Streptomyces sp. NPDC058295 TaxID=3346431 RepID=UPI0036E53FAD
MTPHHPDIRPRPDDLIVSWSTQQRDLRHFVTEARTHPENYPPIDYSEPAQPEPSTWPPTFPIMPPGVPDFQLSARLTDTASAHAIFLKSQDKDWANADQNMHRGPDGNLVWDVGQPMWEAGYHAWRSENVAYEYADAEEVVRFWMQHDAPSKWGHRNSILYDDWYASDDIREAGFGYVEGGPWAHYWVLDMGRKEGPF